MCLKTGVSKTLWLPGFETHFSTPTCQHVQSQQVSNRRKEAPHTSSMKGISSTKISFFLLRIFFIILGGSLSVPPESFSVLEGFWSYFDPKNLLLSIEGISGPVELRKTTSTLGGCFLVCASTIRHPRPASFVHSPVKHRNAVNIDLINKHQSS